LLSFHSLRTTTSTLLHQGRVAAVGPQALIGHDTEVVYELDKSVDQEALERLPQTVELFKVPQVSSLWDRFARIDASLSSAKRGLNWNPSSQKSPKTMPE
jgi:hypothetical protein